MTRKIWIALGSIAVLAVVAVFVLVLAAGSGSDDSSTPASAPPGFGEASQELQACLAEHGVDADAMGSPGSGQPSSGAPSAKMQKAFEACQQYMPQAPSGGDIPAPPGGDQGFAPPSS